jgi:hypothetical protein
MKPEVYDVLKMPRCWTVFWVRQIQYTPKNLKIINSEVHQLSVVCSDESEIPWKLYNLVLVKDG